MRTLTSLGHSDAQSAVVAVQQELERRGKAAVVAVADEHGELIALLRVGDARLPAITIAANKAYTAARERMSTQALGAAVRDPKTGFDISYYGDPRFVGWGGGVPVVRDGKTVGSIAVSGLSEREDIELAELGAAALPR